MSQSVPGCDILCSIFHGAFPFGSHTMDSQHPHLRIAKYGAEHYTRRQFVR